MRVGSESLAVRGHCQHVFRRWCGKQGRCCHARPHRTRQQRSAVPTARQALRPHRPSSPSNRRVRSSVWQGCELQRVTRLYCKIGVVLSCRCRLLKPVRDPAKPNQTKASGMPSHDGIWGVAPVRPVGIWRLATPPCCAVILLLHTVWRWLATSRLRHVSAFRR